MPTFTIANLCAQLGIPVPAQHSTQELQGVATLAEAGPTQLGFLENPHYKAAAQITKAGAVLVRATEASLLPAGTVALVCPQPYVAYARALQLFYPQPSLVGGVSQFAVVSSTAKVHPTARIEPYAVIYAGAEIAEGAHIGAHVVVGEGVIIGAHSRIAPHATLMRCRMGERCLIHSGVRIGQDGFGYAQNGTTLVKIPHIGHVVIGNDVEIGANSTIDTGALSDTILEDHVKLDKQVQIAHNARLGVGVRIAAHSSVAGSVVIGAYTVMGGHVGVAGHLEIAPKCMVAAMSGVTKSIPNPGSVVAGMPAVPIAQWRQQMASLAFAAKRAGKPTAYNKGASVVPEKPAPQPKAPLKAPPSPTKAPKTALPLGPENPSPFMPDDFSV